MKKKEDYILMIIGEQRVNLDHMVRYYPVGPKDCEIELITGSVLEIPEPVEFLDEIFMDTHHGSNHEKDETAH